MDPPGATPRQPGWVQGGPGHGEWSVGDDGTIWRISRATGYKTLEIVFLATAARAEQDRQQPILQGFLRIEVAVGSAELPGSHSVPV